MGQPVVHFEIGCRDRARTEQFFGELFGWRIQRNGPASAIDTASQQGIPGPPGPTAGAVASSLANPPASPTTIVQSVSISTPGSPR